MEINEDDFAIVCFLILMLPSQGQGLKDKAPIYLREKKDMLHQGYNAFAYLDYFNMAEVINWCEIWKVKVPQVILNEFELQKEAARDIGF